MVVVTEEEIALLDAYKQACVNYDAADVAFAKAAAKARRAAQTEWRASDALSAAENAQQEALSALLDGIER